jgi:hypothetical protein
MKRWIPWTIGGVLVAATAGILVATAEQDQGPAFIPGDAGAGSAADAGTGLVECTDRP